ncbi:cupin domain-containing protein [Streptomyces sp. NPDC090493]|uniref:cupin domain-containing protein n=1 Tax=Streptomyces sp. NPDC090493 TaxID=3365964 RepID=UPI00381F9D48
MSLRLRRVVTGRNGSGASVVRTDTPPPRTVRLTAAPAFQGALLWSTDQVPDLSADTDDPTPTESSFVPPPGGTRLHIMRFPPETAMTAPGVDPAAVAAEQRSQMPGLADVFEADGMHVTDTLDYAIVIDGEVWLELDDGALTRLGPGDVVVQQGTRHAWRNLGEHPVTMAFVLVGGTR